MVNGCLPPPFKRPIEQYLAGYVTARNLAPLTRINYASDLKHLNRYLTERLQLTTIDQVRPHHLDGYLVTLDTKGMRGSSRRRHVATIRSLFTFLVQQHILPESPAEELLPPEREREERRVLTEAEYKRLLSAVQHEVRDGAIIELLLQTGIRQSECAGIGSQMSRSPPVSAGMRAMSACCGSMARVARIGSSRSTTRRVGR